MSAFESFHLAPPVARAVKDLGFEDPTPIQEKSIPLIGDGKDVVGQAETGSGKTAAFGLPVLGKIHGAGIQMLVLTPTRELCNQVMESLRSFSRHLQLRIAAVYGGVGMGPQIQAARSANVIVACPGRLLDLLGQGAIDLRHVRFLVLDEADRMFDMGFIVDVERIIRQCPQDRQTLLFSATMPPQVRSMVQRYMRSPVFVETKSHVDRTRLRECYYEVRQEEKFSLLAHLLKHETPGTALVFCGTRRMVDKISKNLRKQGLEVVSIHGGLSQNRRDQAISAIHHKETAVLVATDIAARGLHIQDITHVYNFDLPNVPEDYTHRIGRTARAGAQGDAITLLSDRDRDLMRPILRLGHEMRRMDLPPFERIVMQQQVGHPGSGGHFRDRHDRFGRSGPSHGPRGSGNRQRSAGRGPQGDGIHQHGEGHGVRGEIDRPRGGFSRPFQRRAGSSHPQDSPSSTSRFGSRDESSSRPSHGRGFGPPRKKSRSWRR